MDKETEELLKDIVNYLDVNEDKNYMIRLMAREFSNRIREKLKPTKQHNP